MTRATTITQTPVANAKSNATKRIPVTPETWADLHDQRQAGESYDALLQRIMKEAGRYRMITDIAEAENEGDFIPLEDIDKDD